MLRPTSSFVLLALLAAGALCLEGSRTDTNKKPSRLETPQTISKSILRLEDLLDEAESHHQTATVDKLIADDYRGISLGGGILTKRDILTSVGGTEQATSQSTDRVVRVLENAAVYTALVRDRGTDPKTQEPYTLITRVTDVWQKRGRDWKLVNDQATGIPLERLAP